MDKRIFTAGVKATATDFTDINENSEAGIAALAKAVASAGNTTYVLFQNLAPSISGAGPTYTITVPAQYIAINGVVAKVPQTTLATSVFPNKVWFNITYSSSTGLRDTLTAAGQSVVVEKLATASAILSPTQPAALPEAVLDDSGLPIAAFEYASYDASRVLTHPAQPAYSWSVTAVGVSSHASSHLPGGADPLPLASGTAANGLVAYTTVQTALAALTNLATPVGETALSVTVNGDNNPTAKAATIGLAVNADTFVKSDSGLNLNFPSGPFAGSSTKPARSDHIHTLSASPIGVYEKVLTVTSTTATIPQVIQLPPEVTAVVSVSVYWRPKLIVGSLNFPLISAQPWVSAFGNGATYTGAYGSVMTGNQVRINLARDGLCQLSQDDYDAAVAAAGGTAVWTSLPDSSGRVPQTGELVVRVVALKNATGVLSI